MSSYEKYGEEWHNEVMRNKKEAVCHILASVARERDDYEVQLDALKAEHDNVVSVLQSFRSIPSSTINADWAVKMLEAALGAAVEVLEWK